MFDINQSTLVLYKRLVEKYGKEIINDLIKTGIESKSEIEFGNILRYYFGRKNVKKQFLLENKYYDFILFNCILIEFDGDYWHDKENHKLNDIIKNKIAKKHNYILLRLKWSERKNINFLVELKKIIDEIQIKTNIQNTEN